MPSSHATRPMSWLIPKPEVADRAGRELEQRAAGDDLADVERQRRLAGDRLAQRARVVRRVAGDVGLPLVGVDVDVVDERCRAPSRRAAAACRAARAGGPGRSRCRRCCARPWPSTSISPWTASPSIVRFPSSSAVVPRMTATSIGKAWKRSHSRPRRVTTSTRSSVVRAFCLPPVWRGSTYVPSPTCVTRPGRPAAISRISWLSTPCGNEYDSSSFASTSAPSRGSLPMLLPIVRRISPGRPELREATVGEVADARRRARS